MSHDITRWAAVALLFLAAGCLRPVGPPDCRAEGECECVRRSDCPVGLDCLDGKCKLLDAGGGFGAPCDAGEQCESGWCLPPGAVNGGLCTTPCGSGSACPRAWECKQPPDGGASLCAPPSQTLCSPCRQDSDCGPMGDLCLSVGGERVCARDCTAEACPPGYACRPLDADGGQARQCVPLAETCECSESSAGLTRPCRNANDAGVCFGREVCRSDGSWSGCGAATPAAEVCDGVDNDCDGLLDADDSSVDLSALPRSPAYPGCRKGDGGACVGEWACRASSDAGFAWVCSAAEPLPELCNGRDDDCNDRIDEAFRDSSGRYLDVHHCGSCGFDCEAAIDNLPLADGGVLPGAVACELRGGAPTCVPKRCAPGFFPSPSAEPALCQEAVSSSCRPCGSDGDCSVHDRCISLSQDVGTFCAQGCDQSDPYLGCTGQLGTQGCCPQGYTCRLVGARKLCSPAGDSCSCSPSREGALRACFTGSAASSCVGRQTCLASGEWDACTTESVTSEMCDTLDNDCDGEVDEPFIDTRDSGTYDTDEHCGSCTQNCRALWSPTLQHAIGGCDAGPGRPPGCQIVACTRESVAGGRACQLDQDCGPSRTCHPLYRQCVRACSTSQDCAGNPCRDGYCTVGCTSDGQCVAALGSPSHCDAGACEVRYQFVDTDRDSTNGCECPSSGVADEPDRYAFYPSAGLPYVDRDCDSIDGVAASSLFVWSGSSASLGTRASPFRTIREALAQYDPQVHSAILVAAGRYDEQVVLRNGVKLFGGYSSDFSRRDVVSFPTLIDAPEPDHASPAYRRGTVNAENITATAVLAGFTVKGYDVTYQPGPGGAGASSYAVYVKDSTAALVLANNHVVGGRGGDGAPGAPGSSGQGGNPGQRGKDSVECTSASCSGESQAGGAAGKNSACAGTNGNPGAGSAGGVNPQAYSSTTGGNGRGGYNAYYLSGPPNHSCKRPCYVPSQGMTGDDAQNGRDGLSGRAGAGCASGLGSVVSGEWRPAAAGDGLSGEHGTGGGGGGAGGVVTNASPTSCTGNRVGDLGATGGGGGAGGCAGMPGRRGGGGGGSFGIFVVFTSPPSSLPTIEGNLIETGAGGFGGSGGAGGYGGQGGVGAPGGYNVHPAWCAGKGGHGGRGGNGGAGGGGGGGCGGVAFGLAGNFLAGASYQTANTFLTPGASSAGSPGAGGPSPAGAASSGVAGAAGTSASYQAF